MRRIGQALLERGLSLERSLLILSDNDLEHALLALAAQHVGVPYAPVSPAYSLVSKDFGKLRAIVELVRPGWCSLPPEAPMPPRWRRRPSWS